MRFVTILAITLAVLLAFGVACDGNGEEAQLTPNSVSESEGDADETEDVDEAEEEDEEGDEVTDEEGDDASPGFATSEEAAGSFLEDYGLGYAGDCAGASQETDVGYYCSSLWEDRGDTRIYMAGQTFSEANTWLLVERQSGGDWTVADVADIDFESGEPVSPWP